MRPTRRRAATARPVVGLIAGAAPPVAVLEGAESIGIKLTHVYGLTEVYGPASVCAEQPGWDELPADQRAQLKRRQGVPYPLQEGVTVIDPETMREVPRDGETIGEVMFRGNIVMKGYLKNEKATREAFAGGWFHTGDLGVLDEHGYVIIKDRSKDIIISGGENISSVEVEDILYKHPAVLFAAVVAKPDPKWGEVPCAFVELKDGAQRDRSRDHRVLPRPHVRLQDAEGRGVRDDSEDIDRKDPEIPAAQSGGFGEGDFGLNASGFALIVRAISFCSLRDDLRPGNERMRGLRQCGIAQRETSRRPGARPLSIQRQPHPIIGRDHACRQALPQHLVIQIGMHVGDDRALRLETLDP